MGEVKKPRLKLVRMPREKWLTTIAALESLADTLSTQKGAMVQDAADTIRKGLKLPTRLKAAAFLEKMTNASA